MTVSDRHVVLGMASLVSDTEIVRKATSEAVAQVYDELLEHFEEMRKRGTLPNYGPRGNFEGGYDHALFCVIDDIWKMKREKETGNADQHD